MYAAIFNRPDSRPPPPFSNGLNSYHYLGCAKTFALMGKAFADANLAMLKDQ